eukprot:715795-Heterocapsa_arctica.AAC.1
MATEKHRHGAARHAVLQGVAEPVAPQGAEHRDRDLSSVPGAEVTVLGPSGWDRGAGGVLECC